MSQETKNLNISEDSENDIPVPTLDVKITPDRMMAFLRITNVVDPQYELEKEVILQTLKEKGIVFGIFNQEIEVYCKQKKYYKELKVAKGVEPIRGEDGSVIFHFDTNTEYVPKELIDGSVDFKDVLLIQNIKAGDLLCEIVPPTKGTPGTDVFGQEVLSKPGVDATISTGKNISISEDKLHYTAATDGKVEFVRNTVAVEEVFHVKGDVGAETGNIQFNGSVVISGNVKDGFCVEAKKDIIINGRVEGATIKSEENVVIHSGMNGMQKGTIIAGGDVTSRYIENATIVCGGNFYCGCTLNAKVKAGSSIIMKGKRAALIGGVYVAGDCVVAKEIGSQLNIPMELAINPEWYLMEVKGKSCQDVDYAFLDQEEFSEKIKRKQKEVDKFANTIQDILSGKKMISPEKKTSYVKQLLGLREEKMKNIYRLKDKLNRSIEYQNSHEFTITCTGQIYPGVRINIRGSMLRIDRTATHQKYYMDKGEIVFGVPTTNSDE